MIGVTADTNIYISGLVFGGLAEQFLRQAGAGDFRLDISQTILDETLRVLQEKCAWDAELLVKTKTDIKLYTRPVTPIQPVSAITTDPSDNRILECAVAAGNDLVVTGDTRHLLPLGSYGGIPIVRLAAFLEMLGKVKR